MCELLAGDWYAEYVSNPPIKSTEIKNTHKKRQLGRGESKPQARSGGQGQVVTWDKGRGHLHCLIGWFSLVERHVRQLNCPTFVNKMIKLRIKKIERT